MKLSHREPPIFCAPLIELLLQDSLKLQRIIGFRSVVVTAGHNSMDDGEPVRQEVEPFADLFIAWAPRPLNLVSGSG